MREYIVAGNVMLDTVEFEDGSAPNREKMIGGPATFAYSGVKVWTDSVIQCSRLGADYVEPFKTWVSVNNIDTSGLKVVCEATNHSHIVYKSRDGDASENAIAKSSFAMNARGYTKGTGWEDFGFMKTTPEDIGEFTSKGGVKGVYLAQNCDTVYWAKLKAIKERDGFKLMWELEGSVAYKEFLPKVIQAVEVADIFSLNIKEAERLFDVEGEAACIAELQKLPVDLTLFRVGKRGLYSVTPTEAYYLPPVKGPVVDPTGCGNSSTGSALYAYAEGKDPLMVGIMANIVAAQNIADYGVIPNMEAIRDEAFALADKLYKEYKDNK